MNLALILLVTLDRPLMDLQYPLTRPMGLTSGGARNILYWGQKKFSGDKFLFLVGSIQFFLNKTNILQSSENNFFFWIVESADPIPSQLPPPLGLTPSDRRCINFRKFDTLIYRFYNHHKTFPHVLASLHNIANHFSMDLSFHYSISNTISYGIFSKYMTEKIIALNNICN